MLLITTTTEQIADLLFTVGSPFLLRVVKLAQHVRVARVTGVIHSDSGATARIIDEAAFCLCASSIRNCGRSLMLTTG